MVGSAVLASPPSTGSGLDGTSGGNVAGVRNVQTGPVVVLPAASRATICQE